MKSLAAFALFLVSSLIIDGKEIELPESWNIETITSTFQKCIEKDIGKKISEASPVRYAIYKERGPDTGYLFRVELCYFKGKLTDGNWFISQFCRLPSTGVHHWFVRIQKFEKENSEEDFKVGFQEYENEPQLKTIQEFLDFYEKEFADASAHYDLIEQQNIW